jgi:hypothetical protein
MMRPAQTCLPRLPHSDAVSTWPMWVKFGNQPCECPGSELAVGSSCCLPLSLAVWGQGVGLAPGLEKELRLPPPGGKERKGIQAGLPAAEGGRAPESKLSSN